MDRIWAPWRKTYIQSPPAKGRGCLFCRIGSSRKDAAHLVFKRSLHSFAVLNLYPYNNGHVLIAPLRHVNLIHQLRNDERLDLLDLMCKVQSAIQKKMKPDGFNAGLNFGKSGGAGIPGHLHFHLVPRWHGDVNFMPVLANTKVISESLNSVYKVLSKALSRRSKSK